MTHKAVLDRDDVRRTLVRIAHEIVEKNRGEPIAIVGIHRRGALLAGRLRELVADLVGEPVPLGDVDISFYRDDVGLRQPGSQPVVHASHVDFAVEQSTVVLVDDVLFTGRTVRAAIDALFDYGRPARVQLAVLADRGHRELPIRPDYVGKNLPTAREERVQVHLEELDGEDQVTIMPEEAEITIRKGSPAERDVQERQDAEQSDQDVGPDVLRGVQERQDAEQSDQDVGPDALRGVQERQDAEQSDQDVGPDAPRG